MGYGMMYDIYKHVYIDHGGRRLISMGLTQARYNNVCAYRIIRGACVGYVFV